MSTIVDADGPGGNFPGLGGGLPGAVVEQPLAPGVAFAEDPQLAEAISNRFGHLLDRFPTFDTAATQSRDGRTQRLILLVATDGNGAPARGAPVRLRQNGRLVDQGVTDRHGMILLRFPASAGAAMPRIDGRVRVGNDQPFDVRLEQNIGHIVQEQQVSDAVAATLPGGDDAAVTKAVEALESVAAAVRDLEEALGSGSQTASSQLADALADLLAADSDDRAALVAALGATLDAATKAIKASAEAAATKTQVDRAVTTMLFDLERAIETVQSAVAGNAAVPGDSVLPRLPVIVSTRLADDIVRLVGKRGGPQPCLPLNPCTSRGPVIKWVSLRRTVRDGDTIRRLVVRVRQEWHFVGYTLGELRRVDARDPGTLNATLDATLGASLSASANVNLETRSRLVADAQAFLDMRSSIDTVLDVVARARLDGLLRAGLRDDDPMGLGGPETSERSPGDFFAWLLPDLGADLRATLDASVHAELSVDTSLLVNAKLSAAASLVNQAFAAASVIAQGSLSLEADASASVNPSLARALNLFRYSVYENYLATTHVEDVLEYSSVRVFSQPVNGTFSAADVIEYRPIFEPRLLEPRLAGNFESLRATAAEVAGPGPTVSTLRFDISYTPRGDATLELRVGDDVTQVWLNSDRTRKQVELRLRQPFRVGDTPSMDIRLSTVTVSGVYTDDDPPLMGAEIHVIRVGAPGIPGEQALVFGPNNPLGVLRVDANARFTSTSVPLALPRPVPVLDGDPLVSHVNRNGTYYMGLLVEAALRRPSLRWDSPHLQDVNADVWRLPIVGFEGPFALILDRAGDDIRERAARDEGSAGVVQLASAGLYTEAVQGHHSITDAAGLLHPALASQTVPTLSLAALSNPALVSALAGLAQTGALVDAAGRATNGAGALGTLAGAATGALRQ